MSDVQDKTKQERVFEIKGIPIDAYLTETGDFRWIPASEGCDCVEKTERILEVLKNMPEDRRNVWASRLDLKETKLTCPKINEKADLCKEFDEICAVYSKPKIQTTNGKRGDKGND